MARTKISEFDANPNNNTEIDGINVAEGMSPSGVNNAIRELMSQLKAFQAGTSGDSFNGPVNGALNGSIGATTPSTGAFTTLSASSTVSGAGFTSYLASPPAIGSTTAGSGAFTTLAASGAVTLASTLAVTGALSGSTATFSGNVTLSGGTANSIPYLNGSKVLTTGSALTFDGTNLGVGVASPLRPLDILQKTADAEPAILLRGYTTGADGARTTAISCVSSDAGNWANLQTNAQQFIWSYQGSSEQMRLTSTGLGIGTSSPGAKLDVVTGSTNRLRVSENGSNLFFDSLNAAASAWAPKIERATKITWTTAASGTPSNDMILDSSGNLGLGVTPSAWVSNWRAFDFGAGGAVYSNGASNAALTANAYNIDGGGGWRYKGTGNANLYQTASGQFIWYTAPSGTAGNAISFTQAMTLDASGNLVLGATATGGARARFVASASDAEVIRWDNSAGSIYGVLGVSTTNSITYAGSATNNAFAFITNNTERARIDSSGNLIQTVNTTAATLTTNQTLTFSIVNDSLLRISVRGSDGTTRTATLALA